VDAHWELHSSAGDFGIRILKTEQSRLEERLQLFGYFHGCGRHLEGEGVPRRGCGRTHSRRSVISSPTRSGGSAVTLDEMLASLFPDATT